MFNRVGFSLVDLRVQGRHIQVLGLFPAGHVGLVVQFHSVGLPTEKGVARLQGLHPITERQEGLERRVIGLDGSIPVTLPDDLEMVPPPLAMCGVFAGWCRTFLAGCGPDVVWYFGHATWKNSADTHATDIREICRKCGWWRHTRPRGAYPKGTVFHRCGCDGCHREADKVEGMSTRRWCSCQANH